MPSGLLETDLKFENVAPSHQRLDDPAQLPQINHEPQIPTALTYARLLTDDDLVSIPPSPGGMHLIQLQDMHLRWASMLLRMTTSRWTSS